MTSYEQVGARGSHMMWLPRARACLAPAPLASYELAWRVSPFDEARDPLTGAANTIPEYAPTPIVCRATLGYTHLEHSLSERRRRALTSADERCREASSSVGSVAGSPAAGTTLP